MDMRHASIGATEIMIILMDLVSRSLETRGLKPFQEDDLPVLYLYMIAAFDLGMDYGETNPALSPVDRLREAVQIRINRETGTSKN
jgi:hypothetical protein